MSHNWYAVYTKPQKERRVLSALLKKGIECFCPMIPVKEGRGEYTRLIQQPLFDSLVFVSAAEGDMRSILSIPCVVTVAYWKSKPAIISTSEIDIIRKVTDVYSDIKLEKTAVDMGATAKIIDAPAVEYNEKTISVKYKSIKVNLPSLGFVLTAERVKQPSEAMYLQQGLFTSFPRRINAFFFN